jgi:hypothetical protein
MKKRMILSMLSLLVTFYSYATMRSGDAIPLTMSQNQHSDNAPFTVFLAGLKENVAYQLVCQLTSSDTSGTTVMLEPRLLPASHYANVTLNQKPMPNNSGFLQPGANQISMQYLIDKTDVENYNRFIISAHGNMPFQVTSCTAYDVKTSSKPTQMASASDGGFFYVYNKTNHLITFAVGNIWPSEYVVKPNNWKTVFVSSDNQNIHIKKIA